MENLTRLLRGSINVLKAGISVLDVLEILLVRMFCLAALIYEISRVLFPHR